MDKQPAKNEESWASSLISKFTGTCGPPQSAQSSMPSQSSAPIQSKVPEATSSNVQVPGGLKSIRTPHEPAHSHPELAGAFSPSDVGIWEVDNTRRPGAKPPSSGFSSWGQWFGSSN